MGPVAVIVMPPLRQHLASMGEVVEHFLVEAFVAKLAIEALHEAVLLRLTRSDVMPTNIHF